MKFIIDVALPVPLRQSFSYLPKDNTDIKNYIIGARVQVPFGARKLIGIVSNVIIENKLDNKYKLKKSLINYRYRELIYR